VLLYSSSIASGFVDPKKNERYDQKYDTTNKQIGLVTLPSARRSQQLYEDRIENRKETDAHQEGSDQNERAGSF
jgi:hypothetical protein